MVIKLELLVEVMLFFHCLQLLRCILQIIQLSLQGKVCVLHNLMNERALLCMRRCGPLGPNIVHCRCRRSLHVITARTLVCRQLLTATLLIAHSVHSHVTCITKAIIIAISRIHLIQIHLIIKLAQEGLDQLEDAVVKLLTFLMHFKLLIDCGRCVFTLKQL